MPTDLSISVIVIISIVRGHLAGEFHQSVWKIKRVERHPGVAQLLLVTIISKLAETGCPALSELLDPQPPIIALSICHLTRLHCSHIACIYACMRTHSYAEASRYYTHSIMGGKRKKKEREYQEDPKYKVDFSHILQLKYLLGANSILILNWLLKQE